MSENIGPQFDAEPTPAEGFDRSEYLLEMFERWDRDGEMKRSVWRREAEESYDFVAGNQWAPDDIAALEERGRIPVVFNLSAPTVDAVCGAEIQNRQQVQYFPREPGDSGVADALTQGAEYVSDECNGDQEDSEAFRDCLTTGEGWTHTYPEVDGDQVQIIKERVDPLQMKVDPTSRKACYEDARWLCREIPMSRDEFDDFRISVDRPDAVGNDAGFGLGKRATIVDPRQRYKNGMLGDGEEDAVIVQEWQWWEREPVHYAALPDPEQMGVTKVVPLGDDQLSEVLKLAPDTQHTTSTRKVYYRAMIGGGELLLHEELQERCFRYKAMTGKRDRNNGIWFGLVRAMRDPQRFTNKLYSEIMHIVRTNAKGGLIIEEDAVYDIVQFEQSWAQADETTWVKPGVIGGNKIQPKVSPPIPQAMFEMMGFARDMVRACTGVNEEVLGLVAREQAGVLEAQRKQAAYGILGPFFDAERRYRRDQGRLLLAQMRLYLPEDKLVRIVDKGTAQYVPLAYTMEAEEYDIVVDEAPSSPNQKAKINAVLMQIVPELLNGGLIGPEEVADSVQYLDVPASVSNKLAEGIRKKAEASQPSPEMQQMQQAMAMADLEKKQSETEKNKATSFKTITDAHEKHVKLADEALQPPGQQPATESE